MPRVLDPFRFVLIAVGGWLLGNAGTAPVGITSFHFHDDIDEFFFRSLRSWPTRAPGRKQLAVLSFPQHIVEMQAELQASERWQNEEGGTGP